MRDDILARAGRSGGGRRCWIHRLADSTPCATGGAHWRAEREGIAHRLQRALPGLRNNVYRTDSIEAAFDAWNHYFDLERFAVDVPCVASRAPDSKAQLLC